MQEMIKEEVYAFVSDLIQQYVGKRVSLTGDVRLATDLGIEGFDGIDLLYEVEEKYGIDLAPYIETEVIKKRIWPLPDKKVVHGNDPTLDEFVDFILDAIQINNRMA